MFSRKVKFENVAQQITIPPMPATKPPRKKTNAEWLAQEIENRTFDAVNLLRCWNKDAGYDECLIWESCEQCKAEWLKRAHEEN